MNWFSTKKARGNVAELFCCLIVREAFVRHLPVSNASRPKEQTARVVAMDRVIQVGMFLRNVQRSGLV